MFFLQHPTALLIKPEIRMTLLKIERLWRYFMTSALQEVEGFFQPLIKLFMWDVCRILISMLSGTNGSQ